MPLLSIEFAVFLLLFLPLYWAFARRPKWQNALLLAAGAGWLYHANPAFLAAVAALSVWVHLIACQLVRPQQKHGKRWLALGVSGCLLFLGAFKYYDFFRPYLQNYLGQSEIVDILMPIGVSYYTFQSIAYLVETHRAPLVKPFTWANLLLHLSFFPTITSGPIIRAVPYQNKVVGIAQGAQAQIQTTAPRSILRPALAVCLILAGIAQKWWFAGSLDEGWVSPVFENPAQFDGFSILAAIYGYTFQLFFDFAGYSDLVIGIAMLLGFSLPENFAAPLRAFNLVDFWNRWHISLSTWIRDYVYIPLGGSRQNFTRTQINLLLAMMFSGIWHGYGWNFLIWGTLHGIALVWLNIGKKLFKNRKLSNLKIGKIPIGKALAILITFHFVCFTFVVFNARDLDSARLMFQALLYNGKGWAISNWYNIGLIAAFALMLAAYPLLSKLFQYAVSALEKIPLWLWFIPITLALIIIITFAPSGLPNFIYANF